MRGQGYDGAGDMSGSIRGVPARIQSQFPTVRWLNGVIIHEY